MALTATPIRICQFYFTNANYQDDNLVYTVTQPKVIIKEILLANRNTTNDNASLAIVPQGETLGAEHYIFLNGRALDEESNIFTGISLVCETGDRVYVTASDSDITITVSGVEFTEIV